MAPSPILLRGVSYGCDELPVVFFGRRKPLAYVHNAKAACTTALNFLFCCNNGYAYLDPPAIHFSRHAFVRLGPDFDADRITAYNALAPETFAVVRDPLQRFLSAFISKIFSRHDPNYSDLRDMLTSLHGLDLSDGADPAHSCLAFARIAAAQTDQKSMERHFRPQYLNLGYDGRFRVDTILRLEDMDGIVAFFSRWMSRDSAQNILLQKLGAAPPFPKQEFMSDELTSLVRTIYSRDYELFYS